MEEEARRHREAEELRRREVEEARWHKEAEAVSIWRNVADKTKSTEVELTKAEDYVKEPLPEEPTDLEDKEAQDHRDIWKKLADDTKSDT
ncbi:MAG: hypothetical protein HWN65_22550 [Candidatus Helarchaeota archaeon]|nr:hypothetical protein [Candidatus Helarchaeota archaeon]